MKARTLLGVVAMVGWACGEDGDKRSAISTAEEQAGQAGVAGQGGQAGVSGMAGMAGEAGAGGLAGAAGAAGAGGSMEVPPTGATCTQVILVYGTVDGGSMNDEYCGFMSQDLKKDVLSTFDRQGFLDHWYHSKGGLSSILRLPSVATQGGKWLCLGNAEGPSVVNVYPTMVPPIHVTLDSPMVAGECPTTGGQDVTLNLTKDSTTLFGLPFELTQASGITSLGDPTIIGFHQYRLVKINERPAMLYFLLKALPDPNGSSEILSGYLHYATAESEVIACVGGGVYKDGGLSGDTIVTLNKVSKAGHCPLVPLEVTPPP